MNKKCNVKNLNAVGGLFGVLAFLASLAGCGRFYSAEIAGYIRDSDDSSGINGADVRVYLERPGAAGDDGFIAQTATMTSGGNDGYYNHKIIWQNSTPLFGEEGDSGSVWLGITMDDYFDAIVEVRGVISGTVNVLPDIRLVSATATVSEVTGRVVDANGDGINGAGVSLDLDSTDDDPDYTATTQTVDGEAGTFSFQDVSWVVGQAAVTSSLAESAVLYVDDNLLASGHATDVQITLIAGEDYSLATPITATYVSFSVPVVTGRVLDVNGDGANNVRIVLDLDSTTADPDYVTTTGVINGTSGTYQFSNVSWDDDTPDSGLFDTEGATVYVDDTSYQDSADTTTTVTLTSDQTANVGKELIVTRVPPAEYSTQVVGRCIYRNVNANGISQTAAQGVGVTLTYETEGGTLHTLYDQTDANGAFSFLVRWQDSSPGDFDGPTDAVDDTSIPPGEDGLFIQVEYDDSFDVPAGSVDLVGNNALQYDDPNDFKLKSWLNPNYLPDAVISLP